MAFNNKNNKQDKEPTQNPTPEQIAKQILETVGVSQAELLRLSSDLTALSGQHDALSAELQELTMQKSKLLAEISARRISAKQEAQQEAEQIVARAKQEAKQRADEAKAAAEKTIRSAEEHAKEIRIDIDERNKRSEERERAAVDLELELKRREMQVAERESNAAARFKKQFDDEKQRAEKELAELKNAIADLETQRIAELTRTREEIDALNKQKTQELIRSTENVRLELERREKELDERERQAENKEFALSDKQNEIDDERERLSNRAQFLKDKENSIDERIEQLLEDRYISKMEEMRSLKDTLNRLIQDYQAAVQEKNSVKEKLAKVSAQKDAIEENEQLKLENKKLQNKLDEYLSGGEEKDFAELRAKADLYDGLLKEHDALRRRYENQKTELCKRADDSQLLQQQQEYNASLKKSVAELEEELNRKRVITKEERLESVKRALPMLANDSLKPFDNTLTETEWLEHIRNRAAKSGLVFGKRLLAAYHTSVKIGEWSPLVVLAGVSGTGKSELPRQYALHGGMNFLPVAVKPDWDSPQSLFGYYNSIENKFEATELLRALYQMQTRLNSKKSKQMLMVLLDEMNLAYVELYFSDMLSKFETRRGSGVDAQYEINLGAGAESEMLCIGDNVLWTGTMNEDETTKALSDKVVDRSTLITFPRPKELKGRTSDKNLDPEHILEYSLWKLWQSKALKIDDIPGELMDRMRHTVEGINENMSDLGRNLGHRVWQSIQNYIINHPDVIATKGDSSKLEQAVKSAFAESVAFKIMPKLRGVETTGRYGDILDDINKKLVDNIPELSSDFTKAKGLPSGIFMWHSAEFLEK